MYYPLFDDNSLKDTGCSIRGTLRKSVWVIAEQKVPKSIVTRHTFYLTVFGFLGDETFELRSRKSGNYHLVNRQCR
jgi:hypothetical protein